ncbi:MAG: hypothetical protein SGJ13_16915, partial [Actinomycetota bacterium]|nr:hypothetical protein [Actinomycetota bacterium]
MTAPALVVAMVLAVAATAPAEKHAEPMETIVRAETAESLGNRPALLAAAPQRAALVTEVGNGRVTFRFVDASGQEVASWTSARAAAARLVCTACPDPIVGDESGYLRFVDGSWIAADIGLPLSSLADPLASAFGVVRAAATGRSVALLLNAEGRYLAVVDGGSTLELRATGLRPLLGAQVDFRGAPGVGWGTIGLADTGAD